MRNAIWISRHPCSTEQRAEIEASGFNLVGEADGLALGRGDLQEDEDVAVWFKVLDEVLDKHQVSEAFGVLPAPLQMFLNQYINEDLWGLCWLPFHLAWNVARPVEGKPTGRATFVHKKFVHKKFIRTYLVY